MCLSLPEVSTGFALLLFSLRPATAKDDDGDDDAAAAAHSHARTHVLAAVATCVHNTIHIFIKTHRMWRCGASSWTDDAVVHRAIYAQVSGAET